ncbi:hypothetical protein, partial [Morganella morganii]|uniref:hypothetical protein n=1 Tax=Morganella morganii TaxID=582 RepID=UPI00197C0933
DTSRTLLADVFAEALLERDPGAAPEQVEQAREKAYRSPVLLLAIVDGERGDADTSRTLLADVFAEALLERDPGAAPEQVEQARE